LIIILEVTILYKLLKLKITSIWLPLLCELF
jgi:hypothetical protein